MNGVQNWGDAITSSLMKLSDNMIAFLPMFLGAILVFLAGWIIAVTMGKLVENMLRTVRIDRAMEKMKASGKSGGFAFEYTVSEFFGGLVKWFLVLVFLMAATEILQLNQVTVFLGQIVAYLPNVLVAVVILSVVFLVGNLVFNVVKGSTAAAGVMSATLLATIARWSILVIGFIAALSQLGIAKTMVNTIFIGIVAMLALAGGLAFGLGGKDEAALILRKLREELTHKKK